MKWWRRFAYVLVILLVLPYLIPINEDGIAPAQLAHPDGQFVDLDGVPVYVRDMGAGPPLLLIHGLFGSTESWRYNRDALVDAGYRVIAVDRPAFGLSDKAWAGDYSARNQGAQAVALLDALAVDEAVVVIGHSSGVLPAGFIALDHSERVRGMVIVAGAFGTERIPQPVTQAFAFPPFTRYARLFTRAFLTRPRLEATLAGFQADPSFLTEADYDAYWRTFQTPMWDVGFIALTRDLADTPLRQPDLAAVERPVLLVQGLADEVVPPASTERLHNLLPDSTLVTYAGVGHQPMEEAAARFNADVINWLDALD